MTTDNLQCIKISKLSATQDPHVHICTVSQNDPMYIDPMYIVHC